MEKFAPNSMVLCEIPPFREIPINSDKNKKLAVFNDLLNSTYGNGDNETVVLKQSDIIQSVPNYNPRITNFNQLYQDNVHLNYNLGIPFLKNILLVYLLKISNGVIDFSNVTSNASYKMQNKFSIISNATFRGLQTTTNLLIGIIHTNCCQTLTFR